MNELNIRKLGLAGGILWGAACLLVGLAATYFEYGGAFIEVLGSIYPGYTATLQGSLIGGAIGFIDGGIAGVLLAWIYNRV